MLSHFGARITSEGTTASISPDPELHGLDISVPGDISSAAYFIVAALLVPGSEVMIKDVGINPTRDGILKVCDANECGYPGFKSACSVRRGRG